MSPGARQLNDFLPSDRMTLQGYYINPLYTKKVNFKSYELKIFFPNQVDTAGLGIANFGLDAEISVEFVFDSHTSETAGTESHAIGHEYISGDIFSQG